MDRYEPTKEEIESWRKGNPLKSFCLMDSQVAEQLRRESGLAGASEGQGNGDEGGDGDEDGGIEGFKISSRSKRGPLWKKSEDNPYKTAAPDQGFLLPEVELTPPEEAVDRLKKMFPKLSVDNWEQALKIGIKPAVRACRSLGIDEERLVVFPWIKRKSLARLSGMEEETHYGSLVEEVVFPKLAKLYKNRKLGFTNYRAGKMSTDNYLRMADKTADWLNKVEEASLPLPSTRLGAGLARDDTESDICFSGAVMDLFQGYSVDAVRHETDKEPRLIDSTCYVLQQLLLTQTQLQTKWEELHWWMSGDKYDPDGQPRFPSSLCCDVSCDGFGFSNDYAVLANMLYGSVVFPVELL